MQITSLVVGSSILLASCAGPLDRSIGLGPSTEQLREIDAMSLEDHSSSEPISVEEAAEAMLQRLAERAPAPELVSVSLTDVRAAALANNLDLQVELINPSIAQASLDEERARFEAVFFGSARRSSTDSPTEFATDSSQATIDDFNLGLRIPMRTGGRIILDMPFGRSETDNIFSLINPAYDASARFSISQPLLRGAGLETNNYTIQVAQYERKITDAATRLEAIRILANADRGYWLLYAVRRELDVRLQQYDLAIEQLHQAHRKVQAGEVAGIEVTRAESGVAERLDAIIRAETLVLQQQRNLKRIMNQPDLPMTSSTAVITTTDPSPVQLDLDPAELGTSALANRMEMLELELRLAIDSSAIDFERNNALPLFTLDYSYSFNGLASSFGGAYGQVADRSFDNWTVGLQAEVPIGNDAARARIQRAILIRVQRLATRQQRRLAILQEVYDAVDRLDQDWQRILAARQTAILAGRTYDAEQRQFDVGLRTSTDVLDAAARLADAQSQEVRALADFQVAQVDLAFATGTLLGHGQIRWVPTEIEPVAPYFSKPRYGEEAYEGQ